MDEKPQPKPEKRPTPSRRQFGQVFQRKGGNWYIRIRLRGAIRVQKVGPKKRVAEDLLADLQAKYAREGALGVREIPAATLAEVWKLVKHGRRTRMAPRWFELHERHIERFIRHFGSRPVRDLTSIDIEDFMAQVQARGCKPATAIRCVASLSPVLTEAVRRGLARENVAILARKPRVAMPEVPFLGEPEIRRLLAGAPADLRPIVAILADTGLRRGELLDLEWRDVDLGRGMVMVRKSKTGRGREVPLTTRAREAFAGLRADRDAAPLPREDQVFAALLARPRRNKTRKGKEPSSDRERAEGRLTIRFHRLAVRLGMVGVSVHSLRHSCASRMVAAGVPLSFVARVTGHSTLTCAARYGRHAPSDAGRLAIQALEASTLKPCAQVEGGRSEVVTGTLALG